MFLPRSRRHNAPMTQSKQRQKTFEVFPDPAAAYPPIRPVSITFFRVYVVVTAALPFFSMFPLMSKCEDTLCNIIVNSVHTHTHAQRRCS